MKIVTCFQDITEESSEHGDFENHGVADEFEVVEDAVKTAVSFLADKGPFEPSCTHWENGYNMGYVWLSATSRVFPKNTEVERQYSYHFEGFTDKEKETVFLKLKAKKLL
jgi:hypothetical protein